MTAAESASTGTMEGFQQTATEQRDSRVNGHCKPKSPQDAADVRWTPPEGESGGSNSCGETSLSELTDLQELKARESEDEEEKEEKEVVPSSKGLKGDQKRKESLDQEENNHSKQNNCAASSYTGKTCFLESHWKLCMKYLDPLILFFLRRPVPYLVALTVRAAVSWPRRQRRVWDQRGV